MGKDSVYKVIMKTKLSIVQLRMRAFGTLDLYHCLIVTSCQTSNNDFI